MTEGLSLSLFAVISVFIGLLLGGIAGYTAYRFFYHRMEQVYTFSGGLLAGFIAFELMPEMLKAYDAVGIFLGIAIGILVMRVLDLMLNDQLMPHLDSTKRTLTPVIVITLAVSIHNIPAGLALGASIFDHSGSLSVSLILALALHSIPEGMAIGFPLFVMGYAYLRFFWMALALSLLLGLFSLIGMGIGTRFYKLNVLLMDSAIGAIGYVVLHEILGKARKKLPATDFYLSASAGFTVVLAYFIVVR